MVMSWVFMVLLGVSLAAATIRGAGAELAGAVAEGAQKGISLAIEADTLPAFSFLCQRRGSLRSSQQ